MKRKNVLITGSSGLVGSAAVRYFCQKGFMVHGIDNNMRRKFFGEDGDTTSVRDNLISLYPNYHHYSLDIRDEKKLTDLFNTIRFDLIIHAAGQPSHDWAATEPITDFDINARATLVLLELTRMHSPDAVFIFTSTNKVYGDRPNSLPFSEQPTRHEIAKTHPFFTGIDESMSIDTTTHSIFGVSKAAADLMTQEYGRYFGLNTVAFRCGCLTGPAHQGARLHGFLAYLVKCAKHKRPYTIYGYKGKQVRDNLHVEDLIEAFDAFYKNPRGGEVYNMGGGRYANISIIEAIGMVEEIGGVTMKTTYVDVPRKGDHQWYISDTGKFERHYPAWRQKHTVEQIITELWRNA